MSLTSDLQTYLLAEEAITGIVGTSGVYWQRAPQRVAYPFIIFFRVSSERPAADLSEHAGYVECVYQFDAYSKGTTDATDAIEALRTTLCELEKVTIGTTYIQTIVTDNEREFTEAPNFGQEATIDRVMIEARIVYNETVPAHA